MHFGSLGGPNLQLLRLEIMCRQTFILSQVKLPQHFFPKNDFEGRSTSLITNRDVEDRLINM